MKKILLLFMFLTSVCLGDVEVAEEIFWWNTSRTYYSSFIASPSMSASVSYIWPPADATVGGQALLSDGSGVLSWGVPSTSAAHNLMSGTHSDTTNGTPPARGSVIIGNSTPKWDELAIGAANEFLKSDGTDVVWGFIDIPDSTFRVFDNGDDTKVIALEASSITAGNTRTVTMADNDINFETGLGVENGGTGAVTLTDGGILLGSGTSAITALGVASNGQIPIGDGATDPVLATITATANETDVTNGAGSITIGIVASPTLDATNFTGVSGITGLGTQAEDLDMGFFDIVNPDNMDGSVDATANADAGTVDAQYSFEGTLAENDGGTTLTKDDAGAGDYADRGTTKSLVSTGTNYYFATGYSPVQGNAKRAVSFMVKTVASDASQGVICSWGEDGSTLHRWEISVSAGKIVLSFRGKGASTVENGLNDGQWHHVLVAYDGSATISADSLCFYFDGVQKTLDPTSNAIGETLVTGTGKLSVFSRFSTSASVVPPVGWEIDELAIYADDTMPCATEALDIYNRQKERVIQGTGIPDCRDMADDISTKGNLNADGNSTLGDSSTDTHDLIGTTTLGDGGGIDYAEFAGKGTLELVGDARVERIIESLSITGKGSSAPVERTTDTPYLSWTFNLIPQSDSHQSFEAPYQMDYDDTVTIAVHWYTSVSQTNDEVRWEAVWNAVPEGGGEVINGGGTTITSADTNCPTQWHITETVIGTISGGSIEQDDIIGLHLQRVALVGGTSPTLNTIHVLSIEFEYFMNKLGEPL